MKAYECKTLHMISIGVVIAFSFASHAVAEEPEGHALECYEGTEVIFTSAVADIAEFNAAAYNVTLQNTIPIPEKSAVLYQYGPRDILCVVVSD